MWGFTSEALALLAECVAEASTSTSTSAPSPPLLTVKEDRYGGVEVGVREDSTGAEVSTFVDELHAALDAWLAADKRGVWLQLPVDAANFVPAAVSAGFRFHHATNEYVELVRWLPPTPSPLPSYAFTTLGVGGVVVNGNGEVLMVQERVSPSPRMQGSWKVRQQRAQQHWRLEPEHTHTHTHTCELYERAPGLPELSKRSVRDRGRVSLTHLLQPHRQF